MVQIWLDLWKSNYNSHISLIVWVTFATNATRSTTTADLIWTHIKRVIASYRVFPWQYIDILERAWKPYGKYKHHEQPLSAKSLKPWCNSMSPMEYQANSVLISCGLMEYIVLFPTARYPAKNWFVWGNFLSLDEVENCCCYNQTPGNECTCRGKHMKVFIKIDN